MNTVHESTCYHPLLLFNGDGDCLGAKLRPGTAHSAEDWEEVLLPEIERQQELGTEPPNLRRRPTAAAARRKSNGREMPSLVASLQRTNMKSFTKAVSHITQNLVERFEKASDVATKGLNQTQSDVVQVWQDFDNACKDAEKTSIDAAYAELKEHVTKQMQDGGMSKAEAEKLFEHKWKAVMDLGAKIHKTGKFLWLKVLGVIAAVPVVILCLKMGTAAPTKVEIDLARMNAEMQSFQTSEEQFTRITQMMGDLNVPSAPEPLPIAVAAAAPEPVEVEVTTSSGTQEFTSTVGRVWQSVPQARHEIEQEALHLDHGYDHPDPNSCVATDCLSQHPNRAFHKEFTVNSPIGSAHFKY